MEDRASCIKTCGTFEDDTIAIMRRVAESGGLTALHYAARRGDMEIVELLLEYGAKPSIKNDLGRDVFVSDFLVCDISILLICTSNHSFIILLNFRYCEAFPAIKGAIQRVQREKKRVQHKNDDKKSSKSSSKSDLESKAKSDSSSAVSTGHSSKTFTLQRRLSTATTVKYDMYLMNCVHACKLFGEEEDRKKNFHLCHQDLLEQGKLTRYEDLPLGSFVMFVSHQWNGFNHPDPNGQHLRALCKTLRGLRDGVHDMVSSTPYTVMFYKQNTVTRASEWRELLSNAYLWFDFWCQPQPSMASDNEEFARLQKSLGLAIDSVASYVERSDTMMILVAPSVHNDRIDPRTRRKLFTCYRTWRRRGLCVLELFCAFLSRRKTHPVLLVRSDIDAPMWISSRESVQTFCRRV